MLIRPRSIFPETELLLFAASRAQLVREVIYPSVEDGKIVLCDRFLDSTTVYQGVARQIADDPITQINSFAVGEVVPDLTVVLDVPAEVGLERIKHRVSDMPDRMEQENVEFYGKVREGYLHLARSLPDRFFVVDGRRSGRHRNSHLERNTYSFLCGRLRLWKGRAKSTMF